MSVEESEKKPSGQTSVHYEQLVQKKFDIENQMNELNKILVEEGNVGLNGNLIDAQGYPRADIDIYKVRLARQQINCLRNDHKAIMGQIEKELSQIYSNMNTANGAKLKDNINSNSNHHHHMTHSKPFAKVTQVDFDSPSFEAGIKANDEIIQFGPYTASNTNAKNFYQISDLVMSSQNKIILLSILRDSDENDDSQSTSKKSIKIKLIPKKWQGHGLLGCKIVPIE